MWPFAHIPGELNPEEGDSKATSVQYKTMRPHGDRPSRANDLNPLGLDLPTTFDQEPLVDFDNSSHPYLFQNFANAQQNIPHQELSATSAFHWGLLPSSTSPFSSSQLQEPQTPFPALHTQSRCVTERWMSMSSAETPNRNVQVSDYFHYPASIATDGIENHDQYQAPQIHRIASPRAQFEDMSYAELLYRCLLEAPQHTLPLHEIYDWVADRTDKAKGSGSGWRNSVRHNLSLNEAFVRTEQSDGPGPRHRWTLSPEALTKGIHSTTFYRGKNFHSSRQRDRPVNRKSQAAGALGGRAAHRRSRRNLDEEGRPKSRVAHGAYTHVQNPSIELTQQLGLATNSTEASRHSSPVGGQEPGTLSSNGFPTNSLGQILTPGSEIHVNGNQHLNPLFHHDGLQYFGHGMQAPLWHAHAFNVDANPALDPELRLRQTIPAAIDTDASA